MGETGGRGGICGGYAEGGWMHEGGSWIDVHGGIPVWGSHFEVMVIFGEVVRVGVVLCVLCDGGGGCVEVVVADDPDEASVAGRTDDATCGVADHGCGVRCGGSEEHALCVVVAVEAVEEGEENGVGWVSGEMFEVHTGELVCGEEEEEEVGVGMAESGRVGRNDAIGEGHDGGRRVQ